MGLFGAETTIYEIPFPWVLAGFCLLGLLVAALVAFLLWRNRRPQG
jgi:hypothetical protein